MRIFALAFAAASLAFAGMAVPSASTASASGDRFEFGPRGTTIGSPNRRSSRPRATRLRQPSRLGRTNRSAQVRGFVRRRRDVDRLPISVTRPPNTGHYIFQNYPLWAARAFQPTRSR